MRYVSVTLQAAHLPLEVRADLLHRVEPAPQRRRLPLQRRLHPRQVLGRRSRVARETLHVPGHTQVPLVTKSNPNN